MRIHALISCFQCRNCSFSVRKTFASRSHFLLHIVDHSLKIDIQVEDHTCHVEYSGELYWILTDDDSSKQVKHVVGSTQEKYCTVERAAVGLEGPDARDNEDNRSDRQHCDHEPLTNLLQEHSSVIDQVRLVSGQVAALIVAGPDLLRWEPNSN